MRGLIVEETPTHVDIKNITRRPGSPTVVMIVRSRRADIDKIDLLDAKDRAILTEKLNTLTKERQLLASQLKLLDPSAKPGPEPTDGVSLQKTEWVVDKGTEALSYDSTYYRLVSSAHTEVTALAVTWLELDFVAYANLLPPRVTPVQQTTIVLTNSLVDYRMLVRDQGADFFNPAFYDPAKNRIVCFSDLKKLCDEYESAHKFNDAKLTEWNDYEKEIVKAYKGRVPPDEKARIAAARKKIQTAEEKNKDAWEKSKSRLGQRLAHEAFHAYLSNCVYPPSEGEMPRWLNEGLAQIFEAAPIEAGEMRIGGIDPKRLESLRSAVGRNTLPELKDLLTSGPKQFHVAHASDQQASERMYLASWSLAYYLTFERKLLGTKAMDDYVKSLGRGVDPSEAFVELVGTPLVKFEREYLAFINLLKPDGSVGK